MGVSLTQGNAHFFSESGFMVGLDKPKLYTKFEVASFSHCVNIKGESPNLWELPRARPILSSACDFKMGLGKP